MTPTHSTRSSIYACPLAATVHQPASCFAMSHTLTSSSTSGALVYAFFSVTASETPLTRSPVKTA